MKMIFMDVKPSYGTTSKLFLFGGCNMPLESSRASISSIIYPVSALPCRYTTVIRRSVGCR